MIRLSNVIAGTLCLAFTAARAQTTSSNEALPSWSQERWTAFAAAHDFKLSTRLTPSQLIGDFDGDGTTDVALFVEQRTTHKQGIVFIHHAQTATVVVGAGVMLGNGGDNFEWVDRWSIRTQRATRARTRIDTLLLEHESSASGIVYFLKGRYRWKQLSD